MNAETLTFSISEKFVWLPVMFMIIKLMLNLFFRGEMPPKKSLLWKYYKEDVEDQTNVLCQIPGCKRAVDWFTDLCITRLVLERIPGFPPRWEAR